MKNPVPDPNSPLDDPITSDPNATPPPDHGKNPPTDPTTSVPAPGSPGDPNSDDPQPITEHNPETPDGCNPGQTCVPVYMPPTAIARLESDPIDTSSDQPSDPTPSYSTSDPTTADISSYPTSDTSSDSTTYDLANSDPIVPDTPLGRYIRLWIP